MSNYEAFDRDGNQLVAGDRVYLVGDLDDQASVLLIESEDGRTFVDLAWDDALGDVDRNWAQSHDMVDTGPYLDHIVKL